MNGTVNQGMSLHKGQAGKIRKTDVTFGYWLFHFQGAATLETVYIIMSFTSREIFVVRRSGFGLIKQVIVCMH